MLQILAFFQYILAKKAADKKSAAFVCMCLRNLCLKNQTVRFLRPLARRRASTAVLRSHALQKAMNAAALTLLRLESLLHFVFPPSKFPQYWAFFGDLRLANARRYRGSLADFDYSARTASLSIANREKIHAAIQCQAQRIGFCALRGRAQRTNRCKRARCEVWIWWNVGSKPAFFAIFSTFIAHIVENCTLL